MYKVSFPLILILFYCQSYYSCSIQDTELQFVSIFNRHGNRTPWREFIQYSSNPESLAQLIKPYGYGEITDDGRNCAYQMGLYIRKRYNELLSPTYDPSEMHVRSTFTARTIITALCALAAIYSVPLAKWTQTMNWPTVPYTTVLPGYDPLVPFVNCPAFTNSSGMTMTTSSPEMAIFDGLFSTLTSITGHDISKTPKLIYPLYDLFRYEKSVGLCESKIECLLPEIEVAASKAMEVMFGNEEYIPMEAGVLVNEFFTLASKSMAGDDSMPKVSLFSAHDINVYSVMRAMQIAYTYGPPDFGSLFALEFRKDNLTGKYYVAPLFVSSPGAPEVYPVIEGCGTLCEFSQFQALTSKNAMDIDNWRSQCGWNEDMNIPECGIK